MSKEHTVIDLKRKSFVKLQMPLLLLSINLMSPCRIKEFIF